MQALTAIVGISKALTRPWRARGIGDPAPAFFGAGHYFRFSMAGERQATARAARYREDGPAVMVKLKLGAVTIGEALCGSLA